MEYFGEDGRMIDWKRGKNLLWHRNMKELWNDFNIEIISDEEIPKKVDFDRNRITIIKKI